MTSIFEYPKASPEPADNIIMAHSDSDSDDSADVNLLAWKSHARPSHPPGSRTRPRDTELPETDEESDENEESDESREEDGVQQHEDELDVEESSNLGDEPVMASLSPDDSVRVVIPAAPDLSDVEDYTYLRYNVREVTDKRKKGPLSIYTVVFEDEHIEYLSTSQLLTATYEGAPEALQEFERSAKETDKDQDFAESHFELNMSSTRPNAKRSRQLEYVNLDDSDLLEDVSESSGRAARKKRRIRLIAPPLDDFLDDDEDDLGGSRRLRRRTRQSSSMIDDFSTTRATRSHRRRGESLNEMEESSADDFAILRSDVNPKHKVRAKGRSRKSSYVKVGGIRFDKSPMRNSTRQSGRSTRHQGAMHEIGEDNIHRDESEPRPVLPPKASGAKESFRVLARTDPFRNRHVQQCDTCKQGSNFAPLVYCQGCAFAYHKTCLGTRSVREHLVTKVSDTESVLQCRRCVRFVQKKDPIAPDQSMCQDCKLPGPSCGAFRARKSASQEQKEREANEGIDPVYAVSPQLINNAANVLFRCVACFRGFHFEHLPPRTDNMEVDDESAAALRFAEYAQDWKCKDCIEAPNKVTGIVAWKPLDEDNYDATRPVDEINEDDKVYLIRWEGLSYFRATWMPGAWVWGITMQAMRRAFFRRDDSKVPKMRTEDAILEEFLRVDIVLDVRYTSIVSVEGEEIDKARIREVKEALIKFKGLPYEDAVWETPPLPEDGDRWTDWVKAYNDWVLGKYVHLPKSLPLKSRLEKARALDFATKLEKKKQPDTLIGGELMKYQLEGMNWLYYKWYCQKNAILADEMGLGKTIQIISFMATLVTDWNCFPFLVVVPNATCANWRREIKKWAPALRVVAFFGSRAACDTANRYEIFPRASKEPRCHIIVTSYDAAAEPDYKRFFKSVPWQGLIVDEGQRLKNDKTILYNALANLKIPFRVLLTGTPLQNNARELYNLLQFLDDDFDAAQMEAEYAELDNEKVTKLHDQIRPFFLRRTKAQVLTFLPPMAQIIVPVSMPLVQKKLYRSILAKSPDLLRALFKEKRDLKSSEKGSLNNILMQLRKCLCHPFVYNKGIEERDVPVSLSHRNLVEASGKLQLLEFLLPKLKERGHRVLIFSQFLDMLTMVEDFLDGLGMMYHRLDGTMGSLQKQRRIDDFNAPNSEYFAFLLSTRAGGVGINLATADTVIILDPDFNPHQDIQALSRAHRIGQTKKVLCFQLVTRASAEEKIISIGRSKMALDHVLIEQMDAEDVTDKDLVSILRHGANEIFNDDGEKDIKYEPAQIEMLLDRTQIENTKAGDDGSAQTQFSLARVWANNQFEDSLPTTDVEEQAPDPGVWDKILKEREKAAAAEAAAAKEAFGRGRRTKQRQAVDYGKTDGPRDANDLNVEDELVPVPEDRKMRDDDENDTDFQDSGPEGSDAEHEPDPEQVDVQELANPAKKVDLPKTKAPVFRRVEVTDALRRATYHNLPTPPEAFDNLHAAQALHSALDAPGPCIACHVAHAPGNCALKKAGVERCNLCGLAHFGHARICPHISSETQVRAMLDALKHSPEAGHLVKEAKKYLVGVKGTLVQRKKALETKSRKEEEARRGRGQGVQQVQQQ